MASITFKASGTSETVQTLQIAAYTEELLMLVACIIAFCIWQRLPSRRSMSKRKALALEKAASLQGDAYCDTPQKEHTAATDSEAQFDNSPMEQRLMQHLEQREFTRALNMYRSLERSGRPHYFSENLYSAFIQSAVRVSKIDVVERMFQAMKQNRAVPSIDFWQTMLKQLSSRKHFNTVLMAYTLFNKQIPSDKVIFSCLINAALEIGALDNVGVMLERYRESNIEGKDHVLFFRAYVALNDVDSAIRVFHKLGDQVTPLMLNLLLLTCVNVKQPERARTLLSEAHALEKDGADRIVDSVSYNTAMKGYAQEGAPEEALGCFSEMLSHGVEPDSITIGTLLNACIMDESVGSGRMMMQLLMKRKRPLDPVMGMLFIKGLVHANCLPKALEFYEEMKCHEGEQIDLSIFAVLIRTLVEHHDFERALELREDMISMKIVPNYTIYKHLLEGCQYAGNHPLGKKIFDEMLASGIQPTVFSLVTMLKLHGRCGAHKEAHDLVATWEDKHGVAPSVIHYTCLMSGCLRRSNYEQAWLAYDLMCQKGVPLDQTALGTLLPPVVAARQWDRMCALAKQALHGPMKVAGCAETFNIVLSQLQRDGELKHARMLQSIMRDANIIISPRNAQC
jgi:pentatricopeptide repeat protein